MSNTEQDKGLFSEVFDRIRNPFLAGFVISWCIINYQFLMIVFSDELINWKFAYLAELYPFKNKQWLMNFFIWPILASIAFRFLSHLLKDFDNLLKLGLTKISKKINSLQYPDYTTLLKNEKSQIRKIESLLIEINDRDSEIIKLSNENNQLSSACSDLIKRLSDESKAIEKIRDHAVTLTKEKRIVTLELNLAIEISKILTNRGVLPTPYEVRKEINNDSYRSFKRVGVNTDDDMEGQINKLAFNGTDHTPNAEILIEKILAHITNNK